MPEQSNCLLVELNAKRRPKISTGEFENKGMVQIAYSVKEQPSDKKRQSRNRETRIGKISIRA